MSAFDILKTRGVSRLCHFTKFQSFTHIITSDHGILASSSIRSDTKNVTDTARYDGELDYICCSVEYPNSWFLKKAIQNDSDKIFKEWVALYINLDILNHRVAKFCPCNASKASGAYIEKQMENLDSIFAASVSTFPYPRSSKMIAACPTDGQAEILIKGSIPEDYIIGIAVGNLDIAGRIHAMFKLYEIKPIPIYMAPDVLTTSWSNMIKNGRRPCETECTWLEEE